MADTPSATRYFIGLLLLVPRLIRTDESEQQLLSARCYARCHRLYGQSSSNSSSLVSNCSNPCDNVFSSLSSCPEFCQGQHNMSICSDSCEFIKNQNPNNSFPDEGLNKQDLPSIPNSVRFQEQQQGKVVYLTWDGSNPPSPNPRQSIIYVVQLRSTFISDNNDLNDTLWETLTKTTAGTVVLKEVLLPGRWYQFRVAAVSENGSNGFSKHSDIFTLSMYPRVPGPPRNLREESSKNNEYPIIRWDPPISDLPLHQYRISWVQRLRTAQMQSVAGKESHRIIPAKRLSFILKQLEREAVYQIQVQAIALFKDKNLDGEKATLYINTFSHPSKEFDGSSSNKIKPGISTFSMKIGQPYICNERLCTNLSIENNQSDEENLTIHYLVQWRRQQCFHQHAQNIAHEAVIERGMILPNLMSHCNYSVTARKSMGHLLSEPVTNHFTTPSCEKLKFELNICREKQATSNVPHATSKCPHVDVLFEKISIFIFIINLFCIYYT